MDITIKSVDRVCHVSGVDLEPGSRVRSFLFRNGDGLIDRVDVLDEQRENLVVSGTVICSWGHRIRDRVATEADEKRAALQSAEEVFLSLFEQDDDDRDESADGTRDRLKFFLALQLERKRILKPAGNRKYRHMPTGRVFTVPDMDISQDLIGRFRDEISLMGG